jgi:hypothetical protein
MKKKIHKNKKAFSSKIVISENFPNLQRDMNLHKP